jgi:hypothetical protein
MTITNFSLSTYIFYIYYVLIILLLVFVSDGCETLFLSTSSVIKYHNYPDILNLSSDIYEKHDKLNRFINAGYSGIICVFDFKILILLILFYKMYHKNNTTYNSLLPIITFSIFYLMFIILNGINVLQFYKNNKYIGHQILYLFIFIITLYSIYNI